MSRREVPAFLLAAAILAMSGPWASFAHTGTIVDPLFARLGLPVEWATLAHAALRKVGHVLAYATLGALGFRAVGDRSRALRSAGIAWAFAVLVAGADESLQSLTPARTGCVSDVALDAAGAALGVLVALGLFARRTVASAVTAEASGPGEAA